jgi:cell fate regulator YaaT (PSP1 superfamily)
MGCGGCSSGRGCSTTVNGTPGGCKSNGSCGSGGCNKLNIFDWLANMEMPLGQKPFDVVEVRFKNSRKEFFKNVNELPLIMGELIAVEGTPGHDIGAVSLTGELVRTQMARRGVKIDDPTLKKVYRKVKPGDVEKWQEAQGLEQETMMRSRKMAVDLGLQMKISDVEFQGDKSKAIFYYTAEERVDFRELIKIMAEQFRVRIEMKQIGSRQEAARLGGIGSCGRELCCSTWLSDFRSVNTSAARYQQLSLNPLKLAGQCGKLKCCLNFELDSYLDAIKDFPQVQDLEFAKGKARHQKTDIFRGLMFYTFADQPDKFIPIPHARVKEIIEANKNGEKPEQIGAFQSKAEIEKEQQPDFENVVGQDSLTRFDSQRRNNKNKKRKKKPGAENANAQPRPQNPPAAQQQNKPRPNNPPQGEKKPQQNPPRGNKPPQQNPQGGNKPANPQGGNNNNQPRRNNNNRGPRTNNNRNSGGSPPPPPAPSAPPPFV